MGTASRFALPGALLLITYVSGFWLSALGRPYQGLPFNVHKLIALGAAKSMVVLPLATVPMVILLLTGRS